MYVTYVRVVDLSRLLRQVGVVGQDCILLPEIGHELYKGLIARHKWCQNGGSAWKPSTTQVTDGQVDGAEGRQLFSKFMRTFTAHD